MTQTNLDFIGQMSKIIRPFLTPARDNPMPAKPKSLDLEAALAQLEAIVTQMETGDLSLEDSLKAFEKGIALTRACQQRLTLAEQQVTQLLEREDGPQLEPFDSDEVEDRKSTRLNSSHVRISYAVFCLKKKIAQPDSLANSSS